MALPSTHYYGLPPFFAETALEGPAAAARNHRVELISGILDQPQDGRYERLARFRRRHRDDVRSRPEQVVFHVAMMLLWAWGIGVFLIAVLNMLGFP